MGYPERDTSILYEEDKSMAQISLKDIGYSYSYNDYCMVDGIYFSLESFVELLGKLDLSEEAIELVKLRYKEKASQVKKNLREMYGQ
jgi:hypothetical protein